MRIFFRSFLILILVGVVFAGGWMSSAMIHQNPILAKTFHLSPNLYDKLIQDIVAAVEDSRLAARLASMEEALAASQSATAPALSDEETSGEGNGLGTPEGSSEPQPQTGGMLTAQEAGVLVIDPGKLGQQVYERMPSREKMAFMLWLRSKFDEQELHDLQELASKRLTAENLAEIYRRVRQNMTERDYEYILAIVDKYLVDSSPAQPYAEAGERGVGGSIPY